MPTNLYAEPQIRRLSVKNWTNGIVSAYSDGRMPLDGLKRGGNILLEQDGVVRPRPSMVLYGPQPAGKVLGEIYEFKKVTGLTSENWLISMQSFSVSRSPSASLSPSSSISPSSSSSASSSPSRSPSASLSPSSSTSTSPSSSLSPSASISSSVSASRSPSASLSPSASASPSISPSSSLSPSASRSPSASASISPSASRSPSSSVSASPSAPITGYAQIFIARGEDASWTACTGKFYDPSAEARFFQIGGKVVIMNGVDSLSYLDISTSVVTPFTALSNPSAPTLTTNNVGGTGFNIYYRVTANSTVGETAASNALTVPVDTDRDLWNPPSAGGTDNIIIGWSAVSNATSYNVYMGTVSGFEYLIASGVNGTTFTDDGTFAQDTTRLYPTVNSTAGPKVAGGTVINGRAFLVLDKDNPYYVRWGGDPGFELDFSPANGGGFVPVGQGTKDLPIVIKSFRDGRGNPQITVLCQGTNGLGKRYIMTPDQITVGSTIISFYDVQEDNGKDGTDSRDGVIFYGDSLYYPSRDGFKTTGTKPQLQNVLSTDRISNTIQTDLKSLNNEAMSKCIGLGYEGRLYWALPVNSTMNNEIWVLDLDRKGAWMKPWSISCDWMTLYNDNNGNTHHLILSDNKVYSMTRSALTTDNGDNFITNGQSGEIYFSDDKRMWVQLLQVIFVLGAPRGNINFQVTGKTEDNPLQALGDPLTFEPTANQTVIGWGEVNRNMVGWGRNAWSKVGLTPTTASSTTQEAIIEVDEEIQWASYAWNTTKSVDYSLLDVIFEYIEVGIRDLQ